MNTKHKLFTLIALVSFTAVTTYNPIYGLDMWLQHIGTLVIFIWMIVDIRKPHLSSYGFIGLSIFTALHIFGARWCYTMVPYNQWAIELLNWSPNEQFGWERNHYDRMVHFVFGLCLLPASIDTVQHIFNTPKNISLLIGFLCIQFYSLFYELFEWWLSFTLAPDQVEAYNGQQGDMWDPHKDMALALLGSIITTIWLIIKKRIKNTMK